MESLTSERVWNAFWCERRPRARVSLCAGLVHVYLRGQAHTTKNDALFIKQDMALKD
jgi:hypothetical protein